MDLQALRRLLIDPHVPHVPAVDDAVHDRIEAFLAFRLPQLKIARVEIQPERQVVVLGLLEIRCRRPVRAHGVTVGSTGPQELPAVLTSGTTAVPEVFEH